MPKHTKAAGTAGKTTRPAQPVPAPVATPNHKGMVYTGTLGQCTLKTNPIPKSLSNIITPQTPALWCTPGTVISGKNGVAEAGGGSMHCKALQNFVNSHGGYNQLAMVQVAGFTPTHNNWGTSAGITWPFVRPTTYGAGNACVRMAILNALWVQGTSWVQAAAQAHKNNPKSGTLGKTGPNNTSPLNSAAWAMLSGVYNKTNSAGHTGNPLAKPLSVLVALNPATVTPVTN